MSRNRAIWYAAIFVLFAGSLVIRLADLESPGILPEREFRSLTITRATLFERDESIPEWRKDIAEDARSRVINLEPPVLETIVSWIWGLAGREVFWIPRVINSLLWVCGGLFLIWIALRITSPPAALLITAYYLYLPTGVLVSRSFQPDALMMLAMLATFVAIVHHHNHPTVGRLLMAGILAGITVLLRPLPIFIVGTAFGALHLLRYQRSGHMALGHLFLFTSLTILPVAGYYGYGILGVGSLGEQARMSFQPHLWLHREYWRDWLMVAIDVVGLGVILLALFSMPLVNEAAKRFLLLGMWAGYLLFGLTFSYHASTHGYYHLQLAIIAGLSAAPLIRLIFDRVALAASAKFMWMPVAVALLLISALNLREIRSGLRAPQFESPELARAIGQLVGHSKRAVWVARHYGVSLQYFGEISGTHWPKSREHWLYRQKSGDELSIRDRVNRLGFDPEYVVITDFPGLHRRHSDLDAYLVKNCKPTFDDPRYKVYSGTCLTKRLETGRLYE